MQNNRKKNYNQAYYHIASEVEYLPPYALKNIN